MEKLVIVLNGSWREGKMDTGTKRSLECALEEWRGEGHQEALFFLTGGHLFQGKRISEAMEEVLRKGSVPGGKIFKEVSSRDTTENIKYLMPWLRMFSRSEKIIVLIAISQQHLMRASGSLQAFFIREGLYLPIILRASMPEAPTTPWERGGQVLYRLDPLGNSLVFRFFRWLVFTLKGVKVRE